MRRDQQEHPAGQQHAHREPVKRARADSGDMTPRQARDGRGLLSGEESQHDDQPSFLSGRGGWYCTPDLPDALSLQLTAESYGDEHGLRTSPEFSGLSRYW
jgi:hypothetical protein